MDMSAVDLAAPAVTHFNLPVTGRCSIADDEMVSETVLHPSHTAVVIIEDRSVSLPGTAVVDNDVLPACPRDRRSLDRVSHRRRQISITPATAALPCPKKPGPKTARPIVTVFFDRQLFRCFNRRSDGR